MPMTTLGRSAPFSDSSSSSCTITSMVLPFSSPLTGAAIRRTSSPSCSTIWSSLWGSPGAKPRRDLLGGLVLGHRVQAQDRPLRVLEGAEKCLRFFGDDDQSVSLFYREDTEGCPEHPNGTPKQRESFTVPYLPVPTISLAFSVRGFFSSSSSCALLLRR